ncbi:MAG: phosphonoacetaldehyde hydrolase [Planctomycetaceae bacterium]|nr:phosphonoacetaldehyde hydrolase [Planctomycetaceae bacterium]
MVFDLAGTVVDHGSCAPAGAFCELFARHGITATEKQARIPMGKHKRDHIAEMLAMPEIDEQWTWVHGGRWNAGDLDMLFEEFLPLQLEALPRFSEAIPGAAETLTSLRSMGIKTAATTGYNNAMTDLVLDLLAGQNVVFDFTCCAADVAAGRPRPWMIYRCMEALDVYPAAGVVNVGDTMADVEAGINAGVWSVGVSRTGNMTGLSKQQVDALPQDELSDLLRAAAEAMLGAGADAVIESVSDLLPMVETFGAKRALGKIPGGPPLRRNESIYNRTPATVPAIATAISFR